MSEEVLKYKFLATLKGHKNSSPPTIYYVQETGCLLSGEKDEKETQFFASQSNQENKLYDPNVHPSIILEDLGEEKKYENHTLRVQHAPIKEILVWNLQKDLIHMMQANPPWVINQPSYRFNAHNGSIIDITYLPFAQLIVSSSTDQTIRFFDPVAAPYSLTEPRNFALVPSKPGNYKPIQEESTKSNPTFNEVRRIYTAPMTSYKLQPLNLINTSGGVKIGDKNRKAGSIEWLVALKLSPNSFAGSSKQTQGVISGYGIERIKLMVPAARHDDIVPEAVHKECEEEAQDKRKKSVIAFHSILPYNLEHLLASVTLQTSQTNKLTELFKEAMLNRTTGKYMLSKPLKEVFQILLEIPDRKKYGNIIKEKGRGMVLSVSEVYFYLKKYFQIHPTNLNQVMFAKLVRMFKDDQNKSLIAGTRKWPTMELNSLAEHIRTFGISKDLAECEEVHKGYFTHDEFLSFLKALKLNLNESQLKSIINEIDSIGARKITHKQLQHMFIEEIKQYNIAMFKRPNPINEEIRSKMIPYKKLRLHEALGYMDRYGDGYVTKGQFLGAFQRAGIDVNRENLIYFFDMASEKFTPHDTEKVLSVSYFFKKILTESEAREYKEIVGLFGRLADSLSYKGIDFDILFANEVFSDLVASKKTFVEPIKKHLEFIQADIFISRLNMLHIGQLSKADTHKMGEYLSANDYRDHLRIIYFKNYMHHMSWLPSANKSEPASKEIIVAIVSGKLLENEGRFVKQCYEIGEIVDNCITPSDLRSVVMTYGVKIEFADTFVKHITVGNFMDMTEVVLKMKQEAILRYKSRLISLPDTEEIIIPLINFQDLLHTIITEQKIDPKELILKCRSFDRLGNDQIMIFHLLNVLKHNIEDIEEIVLAGLYYELTLMRSNEYIDYKKFLLKYLYTDIEKHEIQAKEPDEKTKKLYNELLKRIKTESQKLNLVQLLAAFDTTNGGHITKEQLKKSLEWIEMNLNKEELDCLFTLVPKEKQTDQILWYEYSEIVNHSFELATYFNKRQWQIAAQKANLPKDFKVPILELKANIRKQCPKDNIIPKEVFAEAIEVLGLNEDLVEYAILGSRQPDLPQDIETKYVNLKFFIQSLEGGFSESIKEESKFVTSEKKEGVEVEEEDLQRKVIKHFMKIELGFHEFFDAEYWENVIKIEEWKVSKNSITEAIKVLQLPLSLKEERLLLQMAKLDINNNMLVLDFCKIFDSSELIARRQQKVLEKITIAVLLKGFPIETTFEILDKENKGWVSIDELLDLFKQWEIIFSNFEIADIFTSIAQKEGELDVIYEDPFSEKILYPIVSLRDQLITKVKEMMLMRLDKGISLVLEPTNMSLIDFFKRFDYKNSGIIYVDALPKILGELHMERLSAKELEYILDAGSVSATTSEFELLAYCNNLEQTLHDYREKRQHIYMTVLNILHSTIKARRLSIFDFYCQINTLKRDGITIIELVSMLQSLGVALDNIKLVWDVAQREGRIRYQDFLDMFVKAGMLKELQPESNAFLSTSLNQANEDSELVELFKKLYQKNVDWERAFRKEKEEGAKKLSYQGISQTALSNCIRKQQLGFKVIEVEKMTRVLTYRENMITVEEFVKQVKRWTLKKLQEESKPGKYRKYLEQLNDSAKNIDTVFAEVDRDKDGSINVSEHNELLMKLDINISKAEASDAFEKLADKGKLTLYMLKNELKSMNKEETLKDQSQEMALRSFTERSERELVHQKIKGQLLAKETNINNVFLRLKVDALSVISIEDMRRMFEIIDLVLSTKEVGLLKAEVSEAFGKDEFSYQDFIDFLIRKRIDPNHEGMNQGIIISVNGISKALSKNGLSYAEAFMLFSRTKGAYVTRKDFIDAINGMQLALSLDDILIVL